MDITVALGGGGARGAAHIGVLRVLEREGFHIRGIAGTSIGSIVATLYASGRTPDEIELLFAATDLPKLIGRPLSDGPGLLGFRAIADWVKEALAETTFDELRLPCAVVAVDLNSSREIILMEGRVRDAVLGSIAIPGIFPPRDYNEYRLIDGGTLDPVPVQPARDLFPNLPVVAVILSAPLEEPSVPWSVPLPGPTTLIQQLTRLNIAQAFNIFLSAVDIGQRSMTEMRLKFDAPEVVIRPRVAGVNLFDRVEMGPMTELGAAATEAALPHLRRAVAWPARIGRALSWRNPA